MPQKAISPRHIKGLIIQHAIHGSSAALIGRSFKIARSTVRAYIELYNKSDLVHADISNLSAESIASSIRPQNYIYKHAKYITLRDRFFQYHHRLKNENTNMKSLWHEYTQNEPSGLRYSQFVEHYHMWRTENRFSKVHFNKWQIGNIPKEDEKILREWRLSNKRGQWERAVALLDLQEGKYIGNVQKLGQTFSIGVLGNGR